MSKSLVAVAVSSLLFGACSKQSPAPESAASVPAVQTTVVAEAPPPPEPVAPPPPVEEPPPAPAPLSDAQIAKVLETVDSGEIEQAKLAQKKSKNPKVKKFAAHMIQAHTKSKTKGAAWVKKAKLTPEASPVSEELSQKGASSLTTLQGADAAGFDAAYIAAQAQAHQEVLGLIDSRLTPSATDEALKGMLAETRTMVETHITEAKDLEAGVSAAPAAPGVPPAPATGTPGVGGAAQGAAAPGVPPMPAP
jgi:putative membrane protein